ncbi:unnamed protein product [Penicillium olsonii]|nr:unnamed protein product [Penicillium olsonii]
MHRQHIHCTTQIEELKALDPSLVPLQGFRFRIFVIPISGSRDNDKVWALPRCPGASLLAHSHAYICTEYERFNMPLRIAILTCDTPVPEANRPYNGYGGIFTSLLESSATASGLDPRDLEITVFDIVDGSHYPKLEDIDAILMTGSSAYWLRDLCTCANTATEYNSYDDTPWILRLLEYTKKVLAQDRVRILGICFGHQILGRALGTKVGRSDQGWEVSVCDMDLTEKGKEVFGRDKIRIQQMHQDIVFSVPPNVISLGSSPRCEVQGMYAARRFITVQGHSEYNEAIVKEIVNIRTRAGVFKAEFAQDALDRAGKDHDGLGIATVFLKFLLEE